MVDKKMALFIFDWMSLPSFNRKKYLHGEGKEECPLQILPDLSIQCLLPELRHKHYMILTIISIVG